MLAEESKTVFEKLKKGSIGTIFGTIGLSEQTVLNLKAKEAQLRLQQLIQQLIKELNDFQMENTGFHSFC